MNEIILASLLYNVLDTIHYASSKRKQVPKRNNCLADIDTEQKQSTEKLLS